MKNIWFISDTHFHHANILNFKIEDESGNMVPLRPEFSNVDEMDEFMIASWNSNVKQGDYVYHLGDVSMDEARFFSKTAQRLNGRIRLLVGNHDKNIKHGFSASNKFEKIGVTRRFDEFGFICSHYPLHKFSMYNKRLDTPLVNVHGHIHRHVINESGYVNVSVERINYTPIHMDSLIKIVDNEKENLLNE